MTIFKSKNNFSENYIYIFKRVGLKIFQVETVAEP